MREITEVAQSFTEDGVWGIHEGLTASAVERKTMVTTLRSMDFMLEAEY